MNTPMSTPSARSGFTLVELLAVVAIIGVLAGILIPVVGKVRGASRMVVCTSNLRSVYSGLMMYANDRKGELLPAWLGSKSTYWRPGESADWRANLGRAGYLSQDDRARSDGGSNAAKDWTAYHFTVFTCPGYVENNLVKSDVATMAMNTDAMVPTDPTNLGSPRMRVNFFQQPARLLYLSDGSIAEAANNTVNAGLQAHTAYKPDGKAHGGRVNICYLDGHVAALPMAEVPVGSTGLTTEGSPQWLFWRQR
ncbi:MAG TPA: prepilin-type N-terminal cleavage/methylation domain-containing protein [Rariglobus sp.]